MARRAADLFAAVVRKKDNPLIVLPAGHTPLLFYAELVRRYRAGETYLKCFTYLSLDEYLDLPDSDERLFSSWLARELLDPLGIPPERRLIFNSPAPDPAVETARVAELINRHGGIDASFLGLGANGHIGFNEPGSAHDSGIRIVDLAPETRQANAAYWGGIEKVPEKAYTLGIGTLKQVKKTILLVTGGKKANILQAALQEPVSPAIPATYLQDQPDVTIIADSGALSALPPLQE